MWPFTWKISSVGKDEWEFCKFKFTSMIVFVIMIQWLFPSWALAPTHYAIFIGELSIPLFSVMNKVGFSCQYRAFVFIWYTRLQKRWHLISLIHERQDPTPLWEMFAQIHNQWFTSLIIHGKIFSHDKTFSSGKVWIALIIHYVQLMVIINACCVSTFLQSSVYKIIHDFINNWWGALSHLSVLKTWKFLFDIARSKM